MPIVGGLDIHRRQITFDYLDTVTGQVCRGQIAPADREHLRAWLARFAGRDDVAFAVEGCAGLAVRRRGAGRGRGHGASGRAGRHRGTAREETARQDRQDRRAAPADAAGRRPAAGVLDPARPHPGVPGRCWSCTTTCAASAPPGCSGSTPCCSTRAPRPGRRARCAPGRAWPRCGPSAAAQLSPAGQLQVATALEVIDALEDRLHVVRHQLTDAARHLAGAKVLAARLYGVGPVTALAITCWLAGEGRFSSSRQAVRFAGLDITVSSSDRKGPPGRLSRQGPPVLRWAVYEAGKTHARDLSPRPPLLRRGQEPQATASAPRCPRPARSSGRPITSWPSSATTRSPPPPEIPRHGDQHVTASPAGPAAAELTDGGTTAASSRRTAVSRCRPCHRRARRTA